MLQDWNDQFDVGLVGLRYILTRMQTSNASLAEINHLGLSVGTKKWDKETSIRVRVLMHWSRR